MRPRLLSVPFALTLAFAPLAFGQSTVKPKVHVITQDGSGQLHVQVGIEHSAAPSPSFLVRRKGPGASSVGSVTHLSSARPPVVMVLLFDQSGSFKGFRAPAAALAERLVRAIPSGQPFRIAVMTFGFSVKPLGEATDVASAIQLIQQAQKAAVEDKTRLRSSVATAIDKAGTMLAAPIGDRQVVVFSDAGEESKVAPLLNLKEQAFDRAARVSSVILAKQKPADISTLDELKNLAESSGGLHLEVRPGADDVESIARSVDDQHWLSVDVCGVPSAKPRLAEDLVAELSTPPHTASLPRAFTLRVQPRHAEACASAIPSTAPSTAPSAALAPEPGPKPPEAPFPAWLAALGLGAMGLAFVPLLRKKPPQERDESDPRLAAPTSGPSVPPAGPSQTFPEPRVWMPGVPIDPFDVLPELHLVLRSPDGVDRRVPVRARRLRIGRGPDCDLVVGNGAALSPQHVLLEFDPDGAAHVTDTSAAGTFILRAETQRLTPGVRVPLPLGVTLSLANVCWLRLASPDDTASFAPMPAVAQAAPQPQAPQPQAAPPRQKLRYDPTGGAGPHGSGGT